MDAARAGEAVLFVESNTSGTGRIFVRVARELGYHPVLLTARPERYPYLAEADAPEVVVVPRAEEDALLPRIEARFAGRVAGVTSSSEYFIATAATLAACLGRPGPDPERVRAARDKAVQREVLAAGGVPSPSFRVVGSEAEAVAAAREIGFPVVLKPRTGSGSVGVRVCAAAEEVEAHARALRAEGGAAVEDGGRFLVEGFVGGEEFSVELFSGRVIGITRKHLGRPPHFVETGHDYPALLPAEDAAALTDTALRGTRLLGLGWGPLHWELRLHGGRAVPMEVNPRLAGGFIPELIRHAQGIDLIRDTLRLVTGEAPTPSPARREHASIRFLFPPAAGRLAGAEGVEAARALPGVEEIALYRTPGTEVGLQGDFRDRVGHVVARAACGEDAARAAERGRDAVSLRLEGAAGEAEAAPAVAAGGG